MQKLTQYTVLYLLYYYLLNRYSRGYKGFPKFSYILLLKKALCPLCSVSVNNYSKLQQSMFFLLLTLTQLVPSLTSGSSRSSCEYQSQPTGSAPPANPLSNKSATTAPSTPSSSSSSSSSSNLYPPSSSTNTDDFSLADISQNFSRRGIGGPYTAASPSPRGGGGAAYASPPPVRGASAAYVTPPLRGSYGTSAAGRGGVVAGGSNSSYSSPSSHQSPSHPPQYNSTQRYFSLLRLPNLLCSNSFCH
jgi:hypothetical protein